MFLRRAPVRALGCDVKPEEHRCGVGQPASRCSRMLRMTNSVCSSSSRSRPAGAAPSGRCTIVLLVPLGGSAMTRWWRRDERVLRYSALRVTIVCRGNAGKVEDVPDCRRSEGVDGLASSPTPSGASTGQSICRISACSALCPGTRRPAAIESSRMERATLASVSRPCQKSSRCRSRGRSARPCDHVRPKSRRRSFTSSVHQGSESRRFLHVSRR